MKMTKSNPPSENNIRILKWEKPIPLTQEEAEARLHQEGYSSFCWYDVPGANYPKHKHSYDECLWILKGEMHFSTQEGTFILGHGDRIYLPASVSHTVEIPAKQGVTFLVGQKLSAS